MTFLKGYVFDKLNYNAVQYLFWKMSFTLCFNSTYYVNIFTNVYLPTIVHADRSGEVHGIDHRCCGAASPGAGLSKLL